jgi:hypothetical protein
VSESPRRFLELTFNGDRFTTHAIPVDVLAELSTVQALIERVARALFLDRNPERSRVPRGFFDASQLYLIASEANCFTALLDRPVSGTMASADAAGLFDSARDLSLEALHAASDGRPLPHAFPRDALDALGAIGRRLGDDESLSVRGNGVVARVTQTSRTYLAKLAGSDLETVSTLEGEVEELDDTGRSFSLRTRNGQQLVVTYNPVHRAILVEALRLRPAVRIRVRGPIVLSTIPRMRAVEALESIEAERAADVLKLWERLDSFRGVTEGWLLGEGLATKDESMALARQILARLLADNAQVARPKVFPTPTGGVQAEWIIGSWAAEACFEPAESTIEAVATNGISGEERHTRLFPDQTESESATALAAWIRSLG